jgi:hypothetical protein
LYAPKRMLKVIEDVWSIDREDCLMLYWGGASDQIENVSSLAENLSFLLFGLERPFDLCY